MSRNIRILVFFAALLLLSFSVSAQETNGTLSASQPSSMQMVAGEIFLFDYVLDQTSRVSFQAISGTAQPTISVLRNGMIVVEEANSSGAFAVTLNTVLNSGSYAIEVTGVNNTSGLVILSVQNETPLNVEFLTPGTSVMGTVTEDAPFAVFEFGGLSEQAYLYVDSTLPDQGIDLHILNLTQDSARVSGSSPDILGTRLRFGASGDSYQIQVGIDPVQGEVPFELCLTLVSANSCTGESTPEVAVTPVIIDPVATAEVTGAPDACTASPNASGGVNIRQSASTNSIIVGALPSGQLATVLGVSPDNSFFNIQFNSINGWVARSVVTLAGNCDNLQTITPPPVIAPPTATPIPTNTPQPQPPTPFGPCLLRVNSPTYIYTTTIAQVDYLYDQVQSGELVPTGRLADSTWWKTNYAGAWIQSATFGNSVSLLGDCRALPIIAAP